MNDLYEALMSHEDQGAALARVCAVHRDKWELLFASQPLKPGQNPSSLALSQPLIAELSGTLRRVAVSPVDFPVVGDWVAALPPETGGSLTARILAVLPRKSLLVRKRPGDIENDAVVEQALAANVDIALLAMGVDGNFSLRRLERYLTLSWDSGAKPVIILTKADLAGLDDLPSLEERLAEIEAVAFGSKVIATSAYTGSGLAELRALLAPGTCSILLGSSGVGKSRLLNALAGTELQAEGTTRAYDGKGKHTTSSRRLVVLPWGAFLVDTPGMRELQLWGDEDTLASTFPDVELFATACRFGDCAHGNEPGCAVRAALDSGELSLDRFESWDRLRREFLFLERKTDTGAARAEREKWKVIARSQKTLKKVRGY
ncbi:ribosome small subunit-dependent GTPase A [Treponema sp.]